MNDSVATPLLYLNGMAFLVAFVTVPLLGIYHELTKVNENLRAIRGKDKE